MRRSTIPILAAICATITLVAAAPLKESSAAAQLQAAINKETVERDLDAAINQFKAIVSKYAKTDPAVAAEALVHIADCHRKHGDAEARTFYLQVLSDYANQKEAVRQAKASLAAMSAGGGARLTATLVWQDSLVTDANVASDKPLIAFAEPTTGDLMLRDLLNGKVHDLTPNSDGVHGVVDRPVISADGRMVVYVWANRPDNRFQSHSIIPWPTRGDGTFEIRSINTDGTELRTYLQAKAGTRLFPVTFAPDKRTVLVAGDGDIQSLSLADRTLKPFATGKAGAMRFLDARFSPDGKSVVLSRVTSTNGSTMWALLRANADGSGLQTLFAESSQNRSPHWSPDGKWIVFLSERSGKNGLWAISASGGEPRILRNDFNGRLHGFTGDGSLFFTTESHFSDVQVVPLNPVNFAAAAKPAPLFKTNAGHNDYAVVSPDGNWVAWKTDVSDLGTYSPMVVRATAGGEVMKVPMVRARWLPDGQALLWRHLDDDQNGLSRFEIGNGRVSELYRGNEISALLNVTPVAGSNTLVWYDCDNSSSPPCRLVHYDPISKTEDDEPLTGMAKGNYIVASPDGKWLAIHGNKPGESRATLFARPVAAGGRMIELAHEDDQLGIQYDGFTFTPDSKHVLYGTASRAGGTWHDGNFRVVPVQGGTSVSIPVSGYSPSFHPDGRLFYSTGSSQVETLKLSNLPLK